MANKHAYLIVAHKEDDTLFKLLSAIDDKRNDIYIHMDVKNTTFFENDIIDFVKNSEVYFVEPRLNVVWGAYSLVKCTLSLLELACKNSTYQYYHLISGQDMPVKSQDYIHKFFDDHEGMEFIQFESDDYSRYANRTNRYHLFQEKIGRGGKRNFYSLMESITKRLQKILFIHRNKNIDFRKGTNWFSITDELTRYVVSQKQWIEKVFKYTLCADEVFLQTLVHNSKFKDNLYHKNYDDDRMACLRMIDWDRGNPYVFRKDDINGLLNSEYIFARKFDSSVDSEAIDRLLSKILTKK